MELSRFNIVSQIKDSNEFFIINALSGSADIFDAETCHALLEGNLSTPEFIDRGYLVEPQVEQARFREAYLKFLDDRDSDEIQIFFVTGYHCNFDCSYCYQADYEDDVKGVDSTLIIDSFFQYIDTAFAHRRKYLTLFGGEPLLPGKANKAMVRYFIDEATKRGLDVAVVTNGYLIDEYLDILKRGNIREVQVTIDGTREVHNKRRYLKDGKGTFDRIVNGADMLIKHSIPVNLRVVLDKENAFNLPGLARYVIDRGWTRSPYFTTQIGRNYELHQCQKDRDRLYSKIDMQKVLYKMIKDNPWMLEFYKPSFSVSRSLYENGELSAPLFDSCPGAKTEWAFDYKGNIYACTATVGKKGEELGTFFPGIVVDQDKIDEIADRDILSIKECRSCNLSLLCGGGCGAVAKNQTGSIKNPDCRPVKELLELGIAAYFQQHIR
jgi:uncharacterized protein